MEDGINYNGGGVYEKIWDFELGRGSKKVSRLIEGDL